jgi:hypothetical protein
MKATTHQPIASAIVAPTAADINNSRYMVLLLFRAGVREQAARLESPIGT